MFVCDTDSSCIGCKYRYADRIEDIDEEFRNCSSLIEVAEVRHGKWNKAGACSRCGAPIATDTTIDYLPRDEQHYCYFCGAKMDLE